MSEIVPLQKVLELLLANHKVEVAISVGEHSFCSIESNCPMAVKLRKMIEDMGLKVEDIVKENKPELVDPLYKIPEIKIIPAEISIDLYGEPLKVNMSKFITESVKQGIDTHFHRLRRESERLGSYANSLHQTYMQEISRQRKTKVIPALSFGVQDLALARMYMSCDSSSGHYLFYTPMVYEPRYLYSQGIRYELGARDMENLMRSNLYLRTAIIATDMKIYSHTIIGETGSKFHHYHGGGNDCWGAVKINVKWDGTLRHLTKITHELIGSLVTINGDSLMQRHPAGFPSYQDLLDRATRLGREGEMSAPEVPVTGTAFSVHSTAGTGEPVRWGRRS
jgi:hypothetical protein